ncbi:MAG: hypothetical protein WCF57_05750 [Pyrinomonadaceae bacterium]
MNKRIYASFIALVIIMGTVAGTVVSRAATLTPAPLSTEANDPLVMLPASDAVAILDIKRLLAEAMPRALEGNPARLAEANAEIDRFKTRTGIDLRSFDRIAAGFRFEDSASAAKEERTVAIAHGTFNSGAIVAAGRLAAKGKYKEEKYEGKTIYTFTLEQQVKLFGVMNLRVAELAVSELDGSTLAMGDPAGVRAAIDAGSGRGARVNSELVALATRNPNAMIGFGANLPPNAAASLNIDNAELTKNIASIRQVYGSIGTTPAGFDMLTVARTETADQAKNLSDTIAFLKQAAGMLASHVSKDSSKGKLLENALGSMKVTTNGNEVQVRLELAQIDIATLVRGL